MAGYKCEFDTTTVGESRYDRSEYETVQDALKALEATSLFEDHEIEAARAAEVERRVEEIESGRAELIPAADSLARARAAID